MSKNLRKTLILCAALALLLALFSVGVFAAADPVQAVNNLSDFVFKVIKAIGLIILALGIVQLGLSLKSHDPSQRANGFLTVAGGVVVAFAEEILGLITK
jgi:hypothetical protein